MKRWMLMIIFLTLSLAASAQYISRKGGNLVQDGQKLSREEAQTLLSDINGTDYSVVWKDYNAWRKTGLGLTIGGGIAAAGGALTFLTGALVSLVGVAVGATAGAIGGSAGAQAGAEAGAKAGQPLMTGGAIAAGVGVVALGVGIPVLTVNARRMNRIVKDYNGTIPAPEETPAEEPAVEVAFGPAPSGIGFTVSF